MRKPAPAPEHPDAPPRDQLSLVNAHIPVPVNAAVAANVEADGSIGTVPTSLGESPR